MSSKVRTFDFPRRTSLAAAMAVVRAALEDEGLRLIGDEMHGFQAGHGILQEDCLRVVVPNRYIEEVQG